MNDRLNLESHLLPIFFHRRLGFISGHCQGAHVVPLNAVAVLGIPPIV